MAMTYKARRRWALLILLVGLPVYLVAAVNLIDWFDRPPLWLEAAVYAGLGLVWALPFRAIFKGVGQAEPGTEEKRDGQI